MTSLNLIKSFANHCDNGYVSKETYTLYDIYDPAPPLAKHIIYSPMPEDVLSHLIASYKRRIPDELVQMYKVMNGADLFWIKRPIPNSNFQIPLCRLSIFGIPLTNSRKEPEPFNISIEDLNRHADTPPSWLKFGSFYQPDDLSKKYDLFVDTDFEYVYSVMRDLPQCQYAERWGCIDECLCSIMFKLSSADTITRTY